jgi:hypothetical protein
MTQEAQMRKLILAAIAVATLAVPALSPALASASVQRCQAPVTTTTTFSVFQPLGQWDQWGVVWQHDITVTVNPDGTFLGSGTEYNPDHSVTLTENVSGQINPDGTINLTANRSDGVTWSLDHATADATSKDAGTVNYATTPDPAVTWALLARVTPIQVNTTDALNHGQYVSSQGGGKVAAQSCVGMPLNSTQGK